MQIPHGSSFFRMCTSSAPLFLSSIEVIEQTRLYITKNILRETPIPLLLEVCACGEMLAHGCLRYTGSDALTQEEEMIAALLGYDKKEVFRALSESWQSEGRKMSSESIVKLVRTHAHWAMVLLIWHDRTLNTKCLTCTEGRGRCEGAPCLGSTRRQLGSKLLPPAYLRHDLALLPHAAPGNRVEETEGV